MPCTHVLFVEWRHFKPRDRSCADQSLSSAWLCPALPSARRCRWRYPQAAWAAFVRRQCSECDTRADLTLIIRSQKRNSGYQNISIMSNLSVLSETHLHNTLQFIHMNVKLIALFLQKKTTKFNHHISTIFLIEVAFWCVVLTLRFGWTLFRNSCSFFGFELICSLVFEIKSPTLLNGFFIFLNYNNPKTI